MPRLKSGTIAVEGLDELRRELKKLDGDQATEALKEANFKVAELVTREARSRASSPMERSAAVSLRPARQAARAQVSGGGAEKPFFGGAEFGSGRNQHRRSVNGYPGLGYNQFKAWRGNGSSAGYFLYPAIRDATDNIVEVYGTEIDKIVRDAFPD